MYIYCIEKLCTLTAEVEISCKKKNIEEKQLTTKTAGM